MSLITNWCKHWFEMFPNEPIHYLQIVEEVIKLEDRDLYQHFKNRGFVVSEYAWSNIKQLFSEIMNEEDWCILMDIIFSYPENINLVFYFTAALLIEHREELLQINTYEELSAYNYPFTEGAIPDLMSRGLSLSAYHSERLSRQLGIYEGTTTLNSLSSLYNSQFPLAIGYYPVFSAYPQKCSPLCTYDQTVSNELELARTNLEIFTNAKYKTASLEEESAKHRAEVIRLEHENIKRLYSEKQRYLQEQAKAKERARLDSLKEIRDMERYMIESLQTNDT